MGSKGIMMEERIHNVQMDVVQTHYRSMIEKMVYPAYLIKNTGDFPLVCANEAFYELIGYNSQEVEYHFGGRLSALLESGSFYREAAQKTGQPFLHSLGRGEAQRHLYTAVSCLPELEDMLLCISVDITDYIHNKEDLLHAEELAGFVMDRIHADVFEWNVETGRVHVYGKAVMQKKLEKETSIHVVKELFNAIYKDQDSRDKLSTVLSGIESGEKECLCELRRTDGSGKVVWNRITISQKGTGEGIADTVVGIVEDITSEREATNHYLSETQFYHMMLSDKEAYGHLDITDDRILFVGGIWQLYHEFLNDITYSQLIETFINKIVHPEDRAHYLELMRKENLEQSFANGIDRLGCEFRRIVEQNKMVWMRLGVHLCKEPIGGHLLALMYITNIDAEKKSSLIQHFESEKDLLTNIYKKRVTETIIRDYLQQSRAETISAFILLNLDDFKKINLEQGWEEGDAALIEVVTAIGETFRRNDIIGRLGGDEFLVLVKNVQSEDLIAERLTALYDTLSKKTKPSVSCSSGVVLVPGGTRYEEAFLQASIALHEAKTSGKGKFCFYETKESTQLSEVHRNELLIADVMQAMEEESVKPPFDSFVAEQGDLAYLVNPDTYELICGNQAFYDRIGISEAECRGMKCYEAMHRRNTPCPFCSKANWSTDRFFLWKDMNESLEQEFLIKNKLVTWFGREALLALAVDISNNKNIVDSIDIGNTESNILLGTVQQMQKCEYLEESILCALDAIGLFYRAGTVSYWDIGEEDSGYDCKYRWQRKNAQVQLSARDRSRMAQWLRGRQWDGPLIIENPETMLRYSYDMFQMMRESGINNYRWFHLGNWGEEYGCIVVENATANLVNLSFLEAISDFMIADIKKMGMMDSMYRFQYYDRQTGLLNRESYELYLQSYDPDSMMSIGVLTANIDNLKGINASKGYLMGNYYIKSFAELLNSTFSEYVVYRLNGDEFLVIAEDIERTELENRIGEIQSKLKETEEYTVSTGYGWDNVEKDLQELIDSSTVNMHITKKKHYDTGLAATNSERGKMLAKLVKDIQEKRYEIFLQPKINMQTQTLIGAEALIRKKDDKRGIIAPIEFVPILEANNLIRYIDLFVLDEVCRLQERWRSQQMQDLVISLNFSRMTLLEEKILDNVEQAFAGYRIPRNCIEIEITESFVAGGKSTLYRVAQDLYNAGCYLSLDDFGVKYTNISMLADIEFHTLKLDKSLTKALEKRESNQIILKNIVRLCRDMGINVIAEGVETKEQQEILKNLGCILGQGYLFGKPMAVQEFEEKYLT